MSAARAERRRQLAALRKLKAAALLSNQIATGAQLRAEAAPEGPAGDEARAQAHEATTRAFALASALKLGEANLGVLPK